MSFLDKPLSDKDAEEFERYITRKFWVVAAVSGASGLLLGAYAALGFARFALGWHR